jgi:hypothetical protein
VPEELVSFRDYCASQIDRLGGAFPDFRFYKPGAVEELANWLEARANGDRARASQLITEATEFADIPSIADLNAIWYRLFPAQTREPNPNCPHCGGSGWEVITRGGAEGVIACPNKCPVPEWDPMKSIKFRGTAQERERLRRENAEFAAELARDLAGSLIPRKVPIATEADIEAIKTEQEKRRMQSA